jgi:hypothetical protein
MPYKPQPALSTAMIAGGWQRVQAICDYLHERIQFGYHHARARFAKQAPVFTSPQ